VDARPSGAGQTLPLDDDHAAAFAEDQAVSFHIEGAGALMRWPLPSRQPVERSQGGEFQIMEMGEIFLPPADNGSVDDAAADHLHSAIERDQ